MVDPATCVSFGTGADSCFRLVMITVGLKRRSSESSYSLGLKEFPSLKEIINAVIYTTCYIYALLYHSRNIRQRDNRVV